MLKLAQQGALSKPRRNWHQGPTCSCEKVLENKRSDGNKTEAEPGQNGLRPVGPGQPA
jgi:hypothetical protein